MKKIDNASIKDFTTYKLSGHVKTVYFPDNVLELTELLQSLDKYKIIGNGSNLIISSKYDGVLISLKNFDKLDIDDEYVKVGAGYTLTQLSLNCAKRGLSGLEFAYGIPGTVGGAIYQNAGAYGKDMSCVLEKVLVLDSDYKLVYLSLADLKLGYRNSILKSKNYICLEAYLKLKKGNADLIKKEILQNTKIRKEKQPLEYPSAGSVFRNPSSVSAGKLIEDAGLKGTRVGDAMVSFKHANFIVNVGKATGEDVISLIDLVRKKVYDKSGILLKLEQEIIE